MPFLYSHDHSSAANVIHYSFERENIKSTIKIQSSVIQSWHIDCLIGPFPKETDKLNSGETILWLLKL